MPNSKKIAILISLILAGESIFFLPFVMVRIFRPTLLEVFDISNLELGGYFSLYGIVAMLSYFFGGPLADKYPSKILISVALWATSIGGLAMAYVPTSTTLAFLYPYWGFTTIFLFWAALIKATREWGGDHSQGLAFGYLEGGRGLTAALIGSVSVFLFSILMNDVESSSNINLQKESFQDVIKLCSLITFSIGVLVWFVIPSRMSKLKKASEQSSLKDLLELFKEKQIWRMAIIIVCAYVGYKITDDLSLYANVVLGFNEVDSASVGSNALWLRPVFAVLAGYLAHRFEGPSIIIACFAFMMIGGFGIYTGLFANSITLTLLIMAAMLAGVYGIRGIYFAVMKEASIPLVATGSAVGLMSLIGYTPDVFMSPLMGYLLDSYPGAHGHELVFLVLSLFALLGFIVSIGFKKQSKSLAEFYIEQ